MAIINSVVIGRGRKSIGQTTMTTISGICIGRQRILTNRSNTPAQARWRERFRAAMTSSTWLVPLANAAYDKKKLQTPWSRLVTNLMWAAQDFSYDFSAADAGNIAYTSMQAQGDFPMVDGDVKVSNAQYLHVSDKDLLLLTINSNVYGTLGISEGDSVKVDVSWFMKANYQQRDGYDSPITSGGHPMAVGIYDYDNYFVVALQMPLVAGQSTAAVYLKSTWPVLRLNGKRIGLRAWTYFREIGM